VVKFNLKWVLNLYFKFFMEVTEYFLGNKEDELGRKYEISSVVEEQEVMGKANETINDEFDDYSFK
jgi:hypothetical protein